VIDLDMIYLKYVLGVSVYKILPWSSELSEEFIEQSKPFLVDSFPSQVDLYFEGNFEEPDLKRPFFIKHSTSGLIFLSAMVQTEEGVVCTASHLDGDCYTQPYLEYLMDVMGLSSIGISYGDNEPVFTNDIVNIEDKTWEEWYPTGFKSSFNSHVFGSKSKRIKYKLVPRTHESSIDLTKFIMEHGRSVVDNVESSSAFPTFYSNHIQVLEFLLFTGPSYLVVGYDVETGKWVSALNVYVQGSRMLQSFITFNKGEEYKPYGLATTAQIMGLKFAFDLGVKTILMNKTYKFDSSMLYKRKFIAIDIITPKAFGVLNLDRFSGVDMPESFRTALYGRKSNG